MRNYILIALVIFSLSASLLSCTKVVDINLNDSAPRIIIEAGLSDRLSSCTVKLSKTVNFDQLNIFPPVTGAKVSITDDFGFRTSLTEISDGLYKDYLYKGIPGRTYTITVIADEKTYTAHSTMPFPVAIDTLAPESVTYDNFGKTETLNYVRIEYQDPQWESNYYRFIEKINSTVSTDIMIDNDLLRDGAVISQQLYSSNPPIEAGDTVTVYLQTIEEEIYNYFEQLSQVTSQDRGGQAAAPANPISNFSNGALGYFSAYSIRSKKIILNFN